MSWEIRQGNSLQLLADMEPETVQTVITSPPYWGLRDYGHPEQLGMEPTPAEYVARMVELFREVRRVLKPDGTLWLNLGDSYSDKQLQGIPWRVALALQADGWWLRSDIIWHKPNPMPSSVTDRPTTSHEYLFLLTRSARYYYDAGAIKEPAKLSNRTDGPNRQIDGIAAHRAHYGHCGTPPDGRNKRSVWKIATQPFSGAHFAVMPPKLVEPCIKAGSRPGDLVLDPFSGAATVGVVARRLQRSYIGLELNPEFCEMGRRRIAGDAPLFNRVRQ